MDPPPEPVQAGRRGPYRIVRTDENGKTRGDWPYDPPWKRRAPHPDHRPALRSLYSGSSYRPLVLKASLSEDSSSMAWTPVDFGIRIVRGSESEPSQLRTLSTDELLSGNSQAFELTPRRDILRAVPHTWSLSMFDQILQAPPPKPNFHPAHATQFVRRLVLAKMTLIVDIYLRQTYSLTVKAMQNISKIADFDPQRLGEKPWQDEWRSEFFNRLWELRGNIGLLGFDMDNIIRLCSGLSDNTSWPEMQNFETVDGEGWHKDRRLGHSKLEIRDQDMEDLKEWERVEATRKYAAGFIERTTNSYLQAATAEGAKFSNIQARTYVLW